MKKILITICLLFLLCSYNCLYGAYHNSFDLNGLRWELEADKVEGSKYNNQSNWPTNPSVVFKYTAGTSSQTIIYFNMSLTDYSYINPTGPLVTDIVIPSYVNWDSNGSLGVGTGPLQIIESNAFYNKPVTSVDIPSSILTIKLPCFNNCGNLKSIKIDGKDNFTPSLSSLSNYSTLNGVLFNSDKTQLKRYPAGKNDKLFKVPQTVSKLDDGCFANTKNLAIQFFGAAPEIHENAFVNSTAVVYYPKGAEGWPDFDGGGYFDEWGVWAYPIGEQDYVTEDGVILRFHKESSSVIIDYVIYGLGSCTIPSTIGGYPVTSIGDYAFYGCSGLTSITIPDSVTSIGEWAFAWCSGLTSVTIPNSVTSIGYSAFSDCSGLSSVTIPNSVTNIGDSAFRGCSGLTSVTIPDSVTSIGYSAFSDCWGLTSITIGDSVTSIGYGAFCGCSGLSSVTIPNSVTSIEDSAFYDCNNIKSVTVGQYICSNGLDVFSSYQSIINVVISDGVTRIGEEAFYNCSSLTSVTIPDGVTSIGSRAFEGCNDFLYDTTTIQGVKLVDGWVVDYTASCPSVLDLTGVRGIADGAFSGCSRLASVMIPNSVTSIGSYAFDDCNSLLFDTTTIQGVKLVDGWVVGYTASCPLVLDLTGVRGIADRAFEDCSGLTSVTIPNSVTNIGDSAFRGCSGLTSVTIPDSVTSIGEWAFYGCGSLTSITIPNSVTSIGEYAFAWCSGLTSVTIPNSVTSIGERAFYGCGSLTSITIGDSVTSIGEWAFYGCGSLTSITIPNSVTSIGYGAFSDCWVLTSVTIPNSVTSIGDGAFRNCSNLTSVTIPDSVTSIGSYAFIGCSDLIKFIVDSNNPNYKSVNGLLLSKDGKTLIAGINGNVVIPDSVTSIGSYAFEDYGGLTSVTIPDSVTSIEEDAFNGCSDLIKFIVDSNNPNYKSVNGLLLSKDGKTLIAGINGDVVIPDSVTSIGDSAFWNCWGLTSVTIPDSVTSIGDGAFRNCSNLTSVTIPDSVTSIGDGAFYCCSLTSVTIGDSVTSIGDRAFEYCGLTSVTIPDSVTSIGEYAFNGCSGLTSVTIPDSVTSIGEYAFSWCYDLKSAIFLGDAPRDVGGYPFDGCADDFIIKVEKGTKGWDGDYTSTELPETWYGYPIEYARGDDLYPELDANATAEDVANALSGSVDENLTKNITSVEMYNNYREWALSVKNASGDEVAGVEAVKASSNAWLSFALDSDVLIAKAPVDGDVVIDSYEKDSLSGLFEFTVNIKDIGVGGDAIEENLRKVFDIEGTSNLSADFSADSVDISVVAPDNGKVKFSVAPIDKSKRSFFFRVKMK